MSATTTDPTLAILSSPAPGMPTASVIPAPVGFLSRQHILEATEACFADTGYDGTTIRAIAARLGCSVGSIYRYFADKTELLIACAERLFTPVLHDLEIGAPIEQSMRSYGQQVRRNEQMYRLLFFLTANRGGVPQPVRQIIETWTARLGDNRRAQQLWAQLHGQLMLGLPESSAAIEPALIVPAPAAAPLRRPAIQPPAQPVVVSIDPEDVTLL